MVWPVGESCDEARRSPNVGELIRSLSWRPATHQLFAVTLADRAYWWDLDGPLEAGWQPVPGMDSIPLLLLVWAQEKDQAVAFGPSGTYSWEPQRSPRPEPIQFKFTSGRLAPDPRTVDRRLMESTMRIIRAAWQPGDRRVAFGGFEGQVVVLDLESRRLDWADALGQKARERFGCRRENGRYVVPSEFVIRDCLVRIEPGALDLALNAWNQVWGAQDEALAMDGKTMKNALDEAGHQTHIMSVVGHESKQCYAQKKWGPYL